MSLAKHAFLIFTTVAAAFAFAGCAADDSDDELIDESAASELNASDSVKVDSDDAIASVHRKAPGIDVYMPSRMPNSVFESSKFYLNVTTGNYKGVWYGVSFDFTKDCKGANACTAGGVFSSVQTKDDHFKPNMTIEGTKVRYEDISCGASCAPASISWQAKGRIVTVSLKAPKSDLISLAKSTLRAGPR